MKEPVGQTLLRGLLLLPCAAIAGGLPVGFMLAMGEMGKYRADWSRPGIAFGVAACGFVLSMLIDSVGKNLYGDESNSYSWWARPKES